ncbi:hypothetical protein PRIPAC_88368 [Pristionchus pacificus]|uniref:Uncharacterized protein n=1 Tax=Pristionchus pacificus TaxID=54126 RepID=A0A2A6CY45_PRIPA|nr:hypothetical protein PRIPAC_88368 [Pristionchus pacificus]|eukprot:PDM83030.1 hypothetical protein PRIPAC_37423 [Pristionchus pacificus]
MDVYVTDYVKLISGTITLFLLLHSRLSIPPSTLLVLPIHFLSFFSSSTVEEEHDVWYFLLSTSLLIEVFRGMSKEGKGRSVFAPLSVLLLHRFAISFTMGKRRRWNIGEDSTTCIICVSVFPYNKLVSVVLNNPPSLLPLLSPLLLIAIPDGYGRSLRAAVLAPLIVRAVGYGSPQTTACIVWATFLGGIVLRVVERMTERRWLPSSLPSPLFLSLPLLLTIARPHLQMILPVSFMMGTQLGKCRDSIGLTATALSAAFFYTGGGNSLATVDIAVGYAGLREYQEWIVGAQIVLNAYAPCLCVLAGFVSEADSSKIAQDLSSEWMLRRAISLLGCQLALFVFRSHLFVWSVFAPRFLFEATHLTITMADPTPSCSTPCKQNLIQLNKRTVSVSGSSIIIRKGANANKIKEKRIFSKSKIHFLISIGEKNDKKAFFLALASKRIALFQMKKESPIAIFKLDEKIVDHGTVQVLDMERKKEGEFRVEIHFLNERLELRCKIDTEGGPINCLKVDENGNDFLWVGFESGELRMLFMPVSEQNGIPHNKDGDDQSTNEIPRRNNVACKKSEKEMECQEKGCFYKTRSVLALAFHLRAIHRTTLALSGLALLCECGNESISWQHSKQCSISNFTVIRKHDFGPTRTLADKMTPKCILCEAYPMTILGYTEHLYIWHRKQLEEVCKSRFYKLLKLDEESEKKDETEMDQMAESTPLYSLLFQRNLIQLKKKLITAHGNSISIHKGANAKKIREKQIFSKSKIKFLMSIGEENDGKAFFLALSSKRIALFQMKKESPIAIFKLEEKIVDHGTVQVLDMERKKEGEFRVKLIIPIAFHSGTVRKVRLIVHFCDSQITKQKMKCLEEMRIEGEKMRFCVYLGNGNFFGFYEDSVVKSDGLVTRAEEEIHFLNGRLELKCNIDTEGGPINCFKVDENDTDFLWVGFESGELRMLFMPDSEHNGDRAEDKLKSPERSDESRALDNEDAKIKSYKTFSSTAFLKHLKRTHRTILALAGLVLRCQCGFESISDNHSIMCNTPNLTVVRKHDFGPVRTVADKMIPQCTQCKAYPRTVSGYADHLYRIHSKNLDEIGCCLKCEVCGGVYYTLYSCQEHFKKCKSRFYSLLKLGEEEKKKDETEMDQMSESTPPHSLLFQTNLIQLKKKLVTAFFLALASKRIALFQLMKESPIAIFKLEEKIVDHGTVQVLDMGRKEEGEFRVKLIIPIAFHSGTVRKMQLTVHFGEAQVTKQKMKCLDEIRMENEKKKFCVDLGNDSFFGFYEDTVVTSDGLVTRAEEEIHFLNERLELRCNIDTEGGPINCLKMDENDMEFLWVGFESGELRRISYGNSLSVQNDCPTLQNDGFHEEPHVKKSKSDLKEKRKEALAAGRKNKKRSVAEIECLEKGCYYKAPSGGAFVKHLRDRHRATLSLCHITNFTLIRKNDFGPIRTFADKMTPQCILCQAFPKTVCGYADHIYREHGKSLNEIGYFLQCGVCGGDFYTRACSTVHSSKCKSRFYKLLKLGEEVEKNDETEMDQLKNKLVTAHGNSISIHKGANAKMIWEKQIFSKSKIKFLMLIGEENDGKAFFLALSSKRIALFQMKKESPIAIFKLDEKIVDHGTVQVLDMERKKEGEFRVKLIIPIASHSGTMRKMQLTVHFGEAQVTRQKMKCLEEIRMENETMKFSVDLGNDNFFGFYEDTVVKSDGLVTRAEEPSTKKKRRIAVVGRELWHGNILLATENGTIRVARPKDDKNDSSDTLTLLLEGQCVPPYCTLRCREPSVIISMENTVIIGTKRGEIHFLNERLELRCKIDTEGGPINCLKVDENGNDFLWVGFESGELRMLFMPDSEHNVLALAFHLRKIHRTTLALCNISNFTVIRKNDFGPIRTLADKKVITPKCTFCEIGCYLKCEVCGNNYYTYSKSKEHANRCKSRFYTLHKLINEKEKNDKTEMDQMEESTPPHSLLLRRNLIQLKKKLITACDNSISIHKGANAKMIREKQIFSKSKIKFLMSIGEKNDEKAFFLVVSSKRIALFQLKKESPIVIFKKFSVDLGNDNFFGFYEDTVMKSDATENGTIRVVRAKDGNRNESNSMKIISEGQCIPPYCTLRCREPSVIISTENTEIHFLNERLELRCNIDTEGGPINCLKVDENETDFLWVGFKSGEFRRIIWTATAQNIDFLVNSHSLDEEADNCLNSGSAKKERMASDFYAADVRSTRGKRSETDIICPHCNDFKSRVAMTFTTHLRKIHLTNLALSGLVLLCECGYEAISDGHSRTCNISNFTVVRKNYFGPVRTFADKMTPKCACCEMFPRSVYGYAKHLWEQHYKTLDELGCYLKCGVCQGDFYTLKKGQGHSKMCKSRSFSLMKISENEDNKDETEMDQMAESTPPHSLLFQRNLIQLKNKLVTAHGNSISIHKGANAKMIWEKQIFSKSKIKFLMLIGEENDGKAFFLALSSKRIALFQMKKESPIAIFKLDEKIVDHGTVQVLDMERKKEGEFRVKLIIPIASHSGTMRKMQLTVHFGEAQVTRQKMKCLEEIRMENETMKFSVDLGNDNFFGFYEDTVVKSDGLVTRAEEPSTKKKRRIAVVGRELWHGNILLATENGTIRVARPKDDKNDSSDTLTLLLEGQCVPPYCTLRCREPSVIISMENTVIIGTKRGEIHFLNERLELRCKIDTEGGPINCLKVDENGNDFLWVGFESGELRMLFMPDSEHNVLALAFHLRKIHRTTLALCNISNFTVIRKNDFGPIRTLADKKVITPKCTFCEIGCYLKCEVCGNNYYTYSKSKEHANRCKSRFYTLHKLINEKEKNDKTEMDQMEESTPPHSLLLRRNLIQLKKKLITACDNSISIHKGANAKMIREKQIFSKSKIKFLMSIGEKNDEKDHGTVQVLDMGRREEGECRVMSESTPPHSLLFQTNLIQLKKKLVTAFFLALASKRIALFQLMKESPIAIFKLEEKIVDHGTVQVLDMERRKEGEFRVKLTIPIAFQSGTEVHCLNERLEFIHMFETEGGPINCLKIDENDADYLWVGFESGELSMLFMPDSEQNGHSEEASIHDDERMISDEGSEMTMKKSRSNSTETGKKERSDQVFGGRCKRSETEMECPEKGCHFKTIVAQTFIDHLRRVHRTNPALAGLVLRCQCGNESFSSNHSKKCHVSNFTVVRKNFGPIRTLADKKITPKCIHSLRENSETNSLGEIRSLCDENEAIILNNIKIGCYMHCGVCGSNFYNTYRCRQHVQTSRYFKLMKIGENEEKNDEMEMDQTADA